MLALLVAGAFMLLQEKALEPSRPSMESAQLEALDPENVRARLWEDPFAAVARHARKQERSYQQRGLEYQPPAFRLFAEGPAGLEKLERLVVLGVMVFGGPYDEEAERRLRSRHAVLSGLGELGFVPEDSTHIGFFTTAGPPRLEVPFERLRKREGAERVLLLWLEESHFRTEPFERLARLYEGLGIERLAKRVPIESVLLGPYGSTNLRAMAWELQECPGGSGCGRGPAVLRDLRIYSPSATIASALLPPSESEGTTLDERFRAWTGGERSHLLRTIGTDRALADALIEELARRGVRMRKEGSPAGEDGKQHVALISEWDTDYGRGLPCAFVASVTDGDPSQECRSSSLGEKTGIYRFSYLRGLDGQLPRDFEGEKPVEESQPSDRGRKGPVVERPVGHRRLDYLRRLADQLQALDDGLRVKTGNQEPFKKGRGLSAIGVLGSDVYDKLLVLQALRERFPHVIFFTTDLDASLLHPGEYRSTRNLVVVSSFGLELEQALQGMIPAFRDNYQTSLFFSTRLALDPELRDLREGPAAQSTLDSVLNPRVFEVGRTGAFDLSEPRKAPGSPTSQDHVTIHPKRADHLVAPRLNWFRGPAGVALFAAAALLVFWWRNYRDPDEEVIRRWRLRAGFAAALLAGFGALGWLIGHQEWTGQPFGDLEAWAGEPFALLEGISVWPSLFLRLLVAVLSVYFVVASWKDLASSDRRLFADFHMARAAGRARRRDGAPVWRSLPRLIGLRLRRLLRRPTGAPLGLLGGPFGSRNVGRRPESGIWPSESSGEGDAGAIFREYDRRGRLTRRLLRIAPLAIAYFVLCRMVIVAAGEPNVPFRGAISDRVSFVTLMAAVPTMIFLIFWVVDATKLSVWLTRSLADCKTRWPEATLRHFAANLGIDAELLVGWLDIKAIARSSRTVGRLVYTPIAAMILMIASRASFFDNWSFPVGLCVVISMSLFYLIYCAFILRRSAEQARAVTLRRYQLALIRAEGRDDRPAAQQIRLLLSQIASLKVGVFVPFSQQPWVRAVGLLFGGGGTLVLLEYFVWLS